MKTMKLYTVQTVFTPTYIDGGEDKIDGQVECYNTIEECEKAYKKKIKNIKKQIVDSFAHYIEDADDEHKKEYDFSNYEGIARNVWVIAREDENDFWFYCDTIHSSRGAGLDDSAIYKGFTEIRCYIKIIEVAYSEEVVWNMMQRKEEEK